jgi:hypothetical protein
MRFNIIIKLQFILLAFVMFGCKSNDLRIAVDSLSNSEKLDIDYSPNSERFDLVVSDYLKKDGLFTLSLQDKSDTELGQTADYLIFKDQSGKTYAHHLYTIELGLQHKFEQSKSYLIDDNSVSRNSKEKYVIYNQGKSFGYSDESNVEFFPSNIEKGRYDFQVVIYFENSDIYVYSNIIKLDIPLDL